MSSHHDLPSLEHADLANVTAGVGPDISAMLPAMLMLRRRNQTAAPQPMPKPTWKPKITVDGVEQPLSSSANGSTFTTSTGG